MPASPVLVNPSAYTTIPPEEEWLFEPQFSSDDWREAVSLYSPRQLGLGRKRSHAVLTGYVPYDSLKEAVLYFLGWSWVDSNKFLRREVPASHPEFTGLFATEIMEAVGVKFVAKAAKPHKWSLPYATYDLVRLTVAYSQPPYEILADSDLIMVSPSGYKGQEMRRWVNWWPKPYVDMLEFPGGAMVFDGGPADGKPVPGLRTLVRSEKTAMTIVWHNVPIEFVCDPYGFMTKIHPCVGRVNNDTFLGKPAHTWLLDDVEPVNSEVYADPIASAAFEGHTRRLDLKFTFRYFNPTNGKGGSTEAGWRLQPQFNGLWYPVKLNQDNTKTVPEEADFPAMFTHWNS